MAFKMETSGGMVEFSNMLEKLSEASEAVAKQCLYVGAAVMADELKAATGAIPTENLRFLRDVDSKISVLVEDDREDLMNGVGISKMECDGENVNTSVGFLGYTRHPTKKYTSGVPLQMLARSIESGSSIRAKYPFIRKCSNANAQKAQAAMNAKFEELTNNITGGNE